MDLPAAAAPVVAAFERIIAPEVPLAGLYAGGSLGSGDYVPGISDLDRVAITGSLLTPGSGGGSARCTGS